MNEDERPHGLTVVQFKPKVEIAPDVEYTPTDFFANDNLASAVMMAFRVLRATGLDINIKLDLFGLEITTGSVDKYEIHNGMASEEISVLTAMVPLVGADDSELDIDEAVKRFRECLAVVLPPRSELDK